MAQKKAYSRYFIILQQDENGFSLSSDKLPSGYTKLETKNDKCKISYYVQNLKKEMEPYHMLLICGKKDVKKLIKLGIMNIDEHGRAEVTYEYSTSNVAGSGVSIDMVTGAAVVKFEEPNIVSVMSGFAAADTPADWRTYEVYENGKFAEEEVKKTVEEKLEERVEEKAEEKSEQQLQVQEEKREAQGIIFEEYEEKIEEIKNSSVKQEESTNESEKIEDSEVKQEELLPPVEAEGEHTAEAKTESRIEKTEEIEKSQNLETVQGEPQKLETVQEETQKLETVQEEPQKLEGEQPEAENIEQNIRNEEQKADTEDQRDKEIDYPIGTVGEFFKLVAEDFQEVKDVCKEIKRCRWYKVNVNNLEDMCNVSNYNRYTIAYYPMASYYPYIKRYGHYMLGYKYDKSGKMKYIVYAVPGSKNINDQPYGGKSGFVTWVSVKEGEDRDGDTGYWLMFYDFRTSTIVIPVK